MWRDLCFVCCYLNPWGQQLGNLARQLERLLQHKQSLLLQIQQQAKPVCMSGCTKWGLTPSKVQFTNKNCFKLNILLEKKKKALFPLLLFSFLPALLLHKHKSHPIHQQPVRTDPEGAPGASATQAQMLLVVSSRWVSQHLERGAHFHMPPVQKN